MLSNLPYGYPQPDEPENVDIFGVSGGWCVDDILADVSSLEDALNSLKECVHEDVPSYEERTVEAVAQRILEVRLEDGIFRPQAPFYSNGVKRELKRRGVLVTKADELRSSLCHFKYQINELLRSQSIKELAFEIADGAALDDAYRGNYCGYPPSLISRILREMVSQGHLSVGKA